jgi:hypothetical protein
MTVLPRATTRCGCCLLSHAPTAQAHTHRGPGQDAAGSCARHLRHLHMAVLDTFNPLATVSVGTVTAAHPPSRKPHALLVLQHPSNKRVRLVQTVRVGPGIPVGIQLQKAEVVKLAQLLDQLAAFLTPCFSTQSRSAGRAAEKLGGAAGHGAPGASACHGCDAGSRGGRGRRQRCAGRATIIRLGWQLCTVVGGRY